jgi:hypothetical protein
MYCERVDTQEIHCNILALWLSGKDVITRHGTTHSEVCAKQLHHMRTKTYYFSINTKAYDSKQTKKGPCISTQENSPQKKKFVKCDWPTQIFCRKKISTFNNDIFEKFSVRGYFS